MDGLNYLTWLEIELLRLIQVIFRKLSATFTTYREWNYFALFHNLPQSSLLVKVCSALEKRIISNR